VIDRQLLPCQILWRKGGELKRFTKKLTYRWFICLQTVTHPSSNRGQMQSNVIDGYQHANHHTHYLTEDSTQSVVSQSK